MKKQPPLQIYINAKDDRQISDLRHISLKINKDTKTFPHQLTHWSFESTAFLMLFYADEISCQTISQHKHTRRQYGRKFYLRAARTGENRLHETNNKTQCSLPRRRKTKIIPKNSTKNQIVCVFCHGPPNCDKLKWNKNNKNFKKSSDEKESGKVFGIFQREHKFLLLTARPSRVGGIEW